MDDDLLLEYLAELMVAGRAARTLKVRRLQLRGWLAWLAGQGLTPLTATRGDCVAYLGGFPTPETRASYRAALRGFHGWLMETGHRVDDPTCRLPAVRRRPGRPHPIPDQVLLRVLARATPRQVAMLTLGRFAGLRCAEIANAHRGYLTGPPGQELVGLWGKGDRWRELPAHPLVVEVLGSASGWVFPSTIRPGPVQADSVSRALAELLPPGYTGHSLRHAFATEAYARTRDLRLVQDWLGHSSPPVTTVLYVGVQQDHGAMRAMHLVA